MLADDVVLSANFEVLFADGFDAGVIDHELMVTTV